MPKRKKQEEEKSKENSTKEEKTKSTKKKSTKEKYVNPLELLDEYLDEVINSLGIAYLNLDREGFKELIKEPFSAAVGEVKSKPKSRTIINRLLANKEALMEFLAVKLLRVVNPEKLTNDQLEFVVFNIKSAIKDLGPWLYEKCNQLNRKDLEDILRSTWATYGINSPVKCPKCGFNSIMPDLSCYICKSVISMKQLKEIIGVISVLQDYYEFDKEGFKEILTKGYFYYSWDGVIPPGKSKSSDLSLVFEVILNKDEKEKLNKFYTAHNIPAQS
ncbi:hypothetical protein [Sulfolobus acidocaldarius]|uniref:Conserved Crenarchaeal protein n=4 Tax=Sulfolobus acidocaldarius TaxID=2285 RepID=Q4J8Z7_SULAC|nr:hypothetical protein [Sulfolobus acidocaldarius]AAY80733.1 conserved Crenarchaeal protein [Sulfolobus acidocaldarius DSM 639]AGE71330.1 hypothetical protein SacN8_06830 [Sulfolobus acidocaldarius N8]AGE73599.1 hypothetical protein SacRon12I_06820 [Sulfolobus acidocaldarius Ron12/I]ALU30418.1 hypothetical protein ATY89_11000 [Sulfolobus acidocaldarius]ALU31139.1 hypothetical protein ATZ20_02555 [Sulfolobus acidocaldarius]